MESQTTRILNYLLTGKSITPIEALKKFDCFRLGARIHDIKGLNRYAIKSETVVTKTKKRIAKYSIQL